MRCKNSLELCPLLQWAAQQPQKSINNIDLLWANNKHTHMHKDTHTHTRTRSVRRKERQTNGGRGGEGERKKRGSPLTPISLHSSVHWTSEWPLTTFPSIPWTRASTDGTCPPSSQSYSNNASVIRCRLNGRVTEKWLLRDSPRSQPLKFWKCVKLISVFYTLAKDCWQSWNVQYPAFWGLSVRY